MYDIVMKIDQDYIPKEKLKILEEAVDYVREFKQTIYDIEDRFTTIETTLKTDLTHQHDCLADFDLALCQKASKIAL